MNDSINHPSMPLFPYDPFPKVVNVT